MDALNKEGHDFNAYCIATYGLQHFLLSFFTSSGLGMMRPNLAIYRLALELAQVHPSEHVMIDNRA